MDYTQTLGKKVRIFHDSRGRKSWTLTLVLPAWLVLIAKFAVSGVAYNGWTISPMDPIGFSTAFLAIMGPWLYREKVSKNASGTT